MYASTVYWRVYSNLLGAYDAATYSLAAYAIGDWGTTIERDSCCKRRTDHDPTNVDKNAEEAVGVLMGQAAAAAKPKPKVVIGHGCVRSLIGHCGDNTASETLSQ